MAQSSGNLSMLDFENKEYKKAIKQLNSILKKNPETTKAAILLSGLYENEKNFDLAEIFLKKAIDNSTKKATTRIKLAQFYIRNKKTDKAIEIMRIVVAKNPDTFKHSITLASYLNENNEPEKSEQVLLDAIQADPNDLKRHLTFAQFLYQQKKPGAAIAELESIKSIFPDAADPWFMQALIHLKNNDQKQAVKKLLTVVERWDTQLEATKARKKLVEIYYKKEPQKSKILIDQILKEQPNDNDALFMQGKYAFDNKDYDTAITSFRTILKNRVDSIETYLLLTESHIRKNEIELAEDTLKRAHNISPNNISVNLDLARLMLSKKDIEKSEE